MAIKKRFKQLLSLPRKVWLLLKLLVAALRLVFKPNDVSPIFKIGEFRNHSSFECCLNKTKSDPDTKELFENYYLAKETYDLDKLSKKEEGTLGFVFAQHMKHFKLDVIFYPTDDLKKATKDLRIQEINWFRQRARETHDVWHAFLGLPPDHLGEMKISAFYLAQLNSPLSAGILGAGVFYCLIKKPHILPVLFDSICEYWKKGREAKPLMGVKWEELWDQPIDILREKYGIEVVDEAFSIEQSGLYKNLETQQKKYFLEDLKSEVRSHL